MKRREKNNVIDAEKFGFRHRWATEHGSRCTVVQQKQNCQYQKHRGDKRTKKAVPLLVYDRGKKKNIKICVKVYLGSHTIKLYSMQNNLPIRFSLIFHKYNGCLCFKKKIVEPRQSEVIQLFYRFMSHLQTLQYKTASDTVYEQIVHRKIQILFITGLLCIDLLLMIRSANLQGIGGTKRDYVQKILKMTLSNMVYCFSNSLSYKLYQENNDNAKLRPKSVRQNY
ncbi:hypothetical protein BDC45DRAFT_559873 [Circinella umbellata]|nr:hypothetical protein BDC45DRAFT_559873 [Circinella umbellata]